MLDVSDRQAGQMGSDPVIELPHDDRALAGPPDHLVTREQPDPVSLECGLYRHIQISGNPVDDDHPTSHPAKRGLGPEDKPAPLGAPSIHSMSNPGADLGGG
jgi:hypothetical protein